MNLNCGGNLISLERPLVMGIINVNTDSFFSKSQKPSIDKALDTAEQMIIAGADILDIGGQSTAPQSSMISAEEELQRAIPIVQAIKAQFPEQLISIDTFYSRVAQEAVAHGADIVNDISAGNLDCQMIPIIGKLQVPYIAMHMRGTPQTMQQHTQYTSFLTEIIDYFIQKIQQCTQAGIKDIILDPGFGFAKTLEQNFQLMQYLQCFHSLQKPLLVGISRKSMIQKTLDVSAEDALNGSTVLHTIALEKGAKILRVHDVKEAKETIKLWLACNTKI